MPKDGALSEGGAKGTPSTKVIALKDLMGSAKEVQLLHNDQVYRLRLTKANKLILTK
jgi:hemin uptake protein HemP